MVLSYQRNRSHLLHTLNIVGKAEFNEVNVNAVNTFFAGEGAVPWG